MEALSPRSVNIQSKQEMKPKEMVDDEAKKAEAARKAQKEKEYAPPPPEWVIQPPITSTALAEKFKTGKLLGKGGFAVCYEGELRSRKNGSNKKNVFALKIVRAQMSQKKMEEKFRTELQIHAKMRHPNIVEFFRAFTFNECTYVVLELCTNGSVMDMVKKRKCLTLPEVRRLTIQLCGAIKYMHARNVIHRDLKMGNLFLDQEMNLKIGDFGLAAVLVSKDEVQGLLESAKQRRTTLCGTPNYIAPEILEKGKGGHDHKVDIWAIGIIVFAMLAGQPPFQSSSQNEIYRRAKNVEYAWPDERKHSNYIPAEAKDLVTRLLKVDAVERPDPDEIIGHPFFSMHGGRNIPAAMEPSIRYEMPDFINSKAEPRGDVLWDDVKRLNLRGFAKHCGVGLLAGDTKPQPVVGADTLLSLYMECIAEEHNGASPIVPLPEDFVYASKFSSTVWPSMHESVSEEPVLPKAKVVPPPPVSDLPPIKAFKNRVAERPRRAPVQSHAATLRANPKADPEKPLQSDLLMEVRNTSRSQPTPQPSGRQGLISELPVRPPPSAPSTTLFEVNEPERKVRATRSKKVIILDDPAESVVERLHTTRRPTMREKAEGIVQGRTTHPAARRPTLMERAEENIQGPAIEHKEPEPVAMARITSNVQSELAKAPRTERKASNPASTLRTNPVANSGPSKKLIGPNDAVEYLPDSSPDAVLRRLQNLQARLNSCLNSTRSRKASYTIQEIEARSKQFKTRPVVVKWVDYTNKFGIGYILANGGVGCVFRGEENHPPVCIIAPDAESHFKKRNSPLYADRHQIIPAHSPPVEVIENAGPDGLRRVLLEPSQYQVRVSSAGVPDKLGPGFDVYDFEKRKMLCLWDKFGKYMTQTLGKGDNEEEAAGLQPTKHAGGQQRPSRSRRAATSGTDRDAAVGGTFVKFYQRLGNVGIWGFGDGSFQFNFPDHTKLVVSNDGTWLDFYHLPVAAAQMLKSGGHLEAGALGDRSVLCYPTDVLLSGNHSGYDFGDITAANELREKLNFAKDVVRLWIREGGLGATGRNNTGVKWEGVSEKGGKLVWVSIGAHGGDVRYEKPAAASG